MEKDWIEQTVDDFLETLDTPEPPEGWFSIVSILNIPHIKIPTLTDEQSTELYEQAKNVLKISKNENGFKEVSISYSINDMSENKYKKVLGNYISVPILNDKETRKLFETANNNNELIIISIHNHPNNSTFSINDLLIFTQNNGVKLMEIINKKGEISFLIKPKQMDLKNIIFSNILKIIPDFKLRKKDWDENFKQADEVFNFQAILTKEEIIQITKETIKSLQEKGVIYCNYIGKKSLDLTKNSKNTNLDQSCNKTNNLDKNEISFTIENLSSSDENNIIYEEDIFGEEK